MIDRDALVEAVSREVYARTNRGKPNDGWSGPEDWRIIEKITGYYIDAIEPRIREDEQERHGNNCGGMWDEWLHDLKAKVEALRAEAFAKAAACPVGSEERATWDGHGMAHSMTLTLIKEDDQ